MTDRMHVLMEGQNRLGLRENPRKSNHVEGITDQFWFWDDAWCDMWASVVFKAAGLDIVFASCYYSIKAYKAGVGDTAEWLGKPRMEDLIPGDQIFYGNGGADHTGILAGIDIPNRRTLTYEGNWQDISLALWRPFDAPFTFGFGRPRYDDQPGSGSPWQPPMQPAGENPYTPLYVDGILGPRTITAMQWSLNDSDVKDMHGNSLSLDGQMGPMTVSSLQRYLGVPIDGQLGRQTNSALQNHVGVPVDGVWGPQTTKGLQNALNNKTF